MQNFVWLLYMVLTQTQPSRHDVGSSQVEHTVDPYRHAKLYCRCVCGRAVKLGRALMTDFA